MFFISLFYTLTKYEEKNELLIFWLNGVHKLTFLKNLLIYSIFFLTIQILLTTIIVPKTQDMARSYIRSSTMDFFPKLIKEKTFIDAISNLTIYIEKKDKNGELSNIYLKEKLTKVGDESQTIYAKKGRLIKKNNQHWLIMNNGKIINQKAKKSTVFSFEETRVNLSKYSSKTTTFPKIKELNTKILLECVRSLYLKQYYMSENRFLTCEKKHIVKFGLTNKELSDEISVIDMGTQALDISSYIYEFVSLEIPMKKVHPRLRDQERAELAYEDKTPCSNEEEQDDTVDPRWEVLKKIKF